MIRHPVPPRITRTMTEAQAAELEHEVAVVMEARGLDPATEPSEDVIDVALVRTSGYAGARR